MEESEKERVKNEKLGEYFLNLSNTVLGAMVIGTLAMLFTEKDTEQATAKILFIAIGCASTVILAWVGKEYLKR